MKRRVCAAPRRVEQCLALPAHKVARRREAIPLCVRPRWSADERRRSVGARHDVRRGAGLRRRRQRAHPPDPRRGDDHLHPRLHGGRLYDTLNRLSTKAAPSEATVTYGYDLAGRLIGASDTSAAITAAASPSGTLSLASMSYDQLNRPLGFTFGPAPAQTAPTASMSSFAYTYDQTNRRIGASATDNSWWSRPCEIAQLGSHRRISRPPNSQFDRIDLL
jgi:YD repeat-containing protein